MAEFVDMPMTARTTTATTMVATANAEFVDMPMMVRSTTATTMVATANAEFVDMPMMARSTMASDDGGEVEDLIGNIVNVFLDDTIKLLANPTKNMQHVPLKLEEGFSMAGHNRGKLLQAICDKLKLEPNLGLVEFLAIVNSRNEPCEGAPVSQEVYTVLSLIDIEKNIQWSSLIIRQCKDSNETECLYNAYQSQMPDASTQDIMKAVKLHRSRHHRQQTVESEEGKDVEEETFRQVDEEIARLEEQLVELDEDQEDEARLPIEEEDVLVSPETFGGSSSTSPLSEHDVSDDHPQDQNFQDLVYLICRHTYSNGVLFNTVDFRRLLNTTELIVVISSYSISQTLGPLISKNAPKNGWLEGKSCFAMGMNAAVLHALDETGRTLINIDLLEGSHDANAFDNGLPRPLATKAAAFARQIVELSSSRKVTLIGQGKHVNDIVKAAIKAIKCQSTINFLGLSHPTNGSANAFGNHRAFSFAAEMNHVFHQSLEKVNWIGLILQYGPRSDKHNGKGGVISSISGDRSSEIIIDIPTANPHINVVVHCNALGIFDDNDVRLESMISHLPEPRTRTALYLSMQGTEGGKNSHKTDPNCEPGVRWMEEENRYSWSTLARVTKAGLESAAADERNIAGVKYSEKLKRDRWSMSARGLESAAADERNIAGVKYSEKLKRDKLSMSARGLESAAADEGELRGAHLKRKGVGAGIVKTPSMSARGSAKLGYQNTEEPIMLLRLVSSTVNPDAPRHFVPKYTRNRAGIADVLLKNQFLKNLGTNSNTRIKEWKKKASDSDDNSHPFTTRPQSNNAPRASDKWILSLHESVESVLKIAPNATEVNDDDRAVSASYREGDAQRSAKSRKRKP